MSMPDVGEALPERVVLGAGGLLERPRAQVRVGRARAPGVGEQRVGEGLGAVGGVTAARPHAHAGQVGVTVRRPSRAHCRMR